MWWNVDENECDSNKNPQNEKDKILDYYNKYLKTNNNGGGGSGELSLDNDIKEDLGNKKDNDDRILQKSFYLYQKKKTWQRIYKKKVKIKKQKALQIIITKMLLMIQNINYLWMI